MWKPACDTGFAALMPVPSEVFHAVNAILVRTPGPVQRRTHWHGTLKTIRWKFIQGLLTPICWMVPRPTHTYTLSVSKPPNWSCLCLKPTMLNCASHGTSWGSTKTKLRSDGRYCSESTAMAKSWSTVLSVHKFAYWKCSASSKITWWHFDHQLFWVKVTVGVDEIKGSFHLLDLGLGQMEMVMKITMTLV